MKNAPEDRTQPVEFHAHDEDDRAELAQALARRTPAWKPVVAGLVLVLATGALVFAGALPRIARAEEVGSTNAALLQNARRVQFVNAKLGAPTRTLRLPATLAANASVDLLPQVAGYVRERRHDLGDRVDAGELLAVIDVPLLEEDLNRARASLDEASAAQEVLAREFALAQSTLERWRSVQPPGAVSKQELDARQSDFEAARAKETAGRATIQSRRAEVQRFERQREFARITAPFRGTVTARGVDVGDYVGGAGAKALFHLADTSVLRAFVDVPQSWTAGIAVGRAARVRLRERPGRVFDGTIVRTSGALDERTRTLQVQVDVPNEKGELLPGSYAEVELELARESVPVVVPGAALLVRAEGPRVAVVDEANALRYMRVTVARDLGSEVELSEGLKGGERVVVNMADELPEGSTVEAVPLPAPPPPAGAKPSDAKPGEAKPADTKPSDAKPSDVKPGTSPTPKSNGDH